IAARKGAPRILILTTFDLDDYVYEALRAGASGFLLKDARAEELRQAVRMVASGDALLSPAITRRLIESYTRRPPPTVHPTQLTARRTGCSKAPHISEEYGALWGRSGSLVGDGLMRLVAWRDSRRSRDPRPSG